MISTEPAGNRHGSSSSPRFPHGSHRFPTGSQPTVPPVPGLLHTGNREPFPGGLRNWLHNLKTRDLKITIAQTEPRITGPLASITPQDSHALTRYRHALTVAAAGTHPDWWNHILGRAPHPAGLADIPDTTDPSSGDGLAFACATCGHPAHTLDSNLLAWCNEHE